MILWQHYVINKFIPVSRHNLCIVDLLYVKITYFRHTPVKSALTVRAFCRNTVHISNDGTLMNLNFI